MNLYYKQMKKLGLNTKQYAKLIDMPYDVVLDLLNERGSYKMSVTDLLRRNLFEKHQEIENDMDNAKMKALEIATNDIDYLKWYNEEYTADMLKEKTKLPSVKKFERTYYIEIRGKKASHWYYSCICGKIRYDNHDIKKDVLYEFARQLYDILINGNKKPYLDKQKKIDKYRNQDEILEWYKNFNFRLFRQKHNLSNKDMAKAIGTTLTTMYQLSANDYQSFGLIKKLYDYVMEKEGEPSIVDDKIQESDIKEHFEKENDIEEDRTKIFDGIRKAQIDGDTKMVEELKHEYFTNWNNEPIYITTNTKQPEIEPLYDDVLRKILINRLTDEEKELIRIFGGKLD